eukprot:12435663-Prorocentrum_lima.AAC.1
MSSTRPFRPSVQLPASPCPRTTGRPPHPPPPPPAGTGCRCAAASSRSSPVAPLPLILAARGALQPSGPLRTAAGPSAA